MVRHGRVGCGSVRYAKGPNGRRDVEASEGDREMDDYKFFAASMGLPTGSRDRYALEESPAASRTEPPPRSEEERPVPKRKK